MRPNHQPSRGSILQAGILVFLCTLMTPFAGACLGTPPPLCARTLVFSTSAPGALIGPGGAAINVGVPGLAYFNVIEAPPGACPSLRAGGETASLSVDVDVECQGPNDGSGSLTPTNIGTRFTDVSLDVSLAAGPPRLCDITSTATATMLDGTTLTASSSNNVCVGESAPGNPNLARLDMRVADGGSNLLRVHPGDQAEVTYRITNNDPVASFSGKLSVALQNSSRTPQQAPTPNSLDDGPFAISSPVEGDNFPIGFSEDLVNGCLYIPRDHDNPAPSTLSKIVDLESGESIDVDVYTRPFGGCADGSCGVALVQLEGSFSDQSEGLACSGFVAAADTSVPPTFAWADGGAAFAFASSPAPFVLEFIAQPNDSQTVPLAFVKEFPSLTIDDEEPPVSLFPESFPYEGDRGRITAQANLTGQLIPGDVSFSYSNDIQISPGAPLQFEFTDINPNAPTGHEAHAPGAVLVVGYRSFGQDDNEFFTDIMYQFSATATYDGGDKQSLVIDDFAVSPGQFPNEFTVTASGTIPAGDGTDLSTLTFANDIRGFARPASDYDLDGVNDDVDNCTLAANPDQLDSNGDGFGNACDADINDDGIVNVIDLGALKQAFFSSPGDVHWNPDADFNGDDVVNAIDLGSLKAAFFQPPGPSDTSP